MYFSINNSMYKFVLFLKSINVKIFILFMSNQNLYVCNFVIFNVTCFIYGNFPRKSCVDGKLER